MIGYSDSSFSSSLCAPGTPPKANSPLVDQHRLTAGNDKRGGPIQLTPLWEHVVRTQSVPKDANLTDIFVALNDRLRDPEWEVRQHALRVLVDVIPVMDDTLDQRMEILLGDLVGNLGHPGPAVRKGALDSLKVYLAHSMHADDILHNIVYRGVENYTDSQLQSEVVVGIILSLPNLIFPGSTSERTVEYVVRSLIAKLVQVTFQEVSLRSLTRIRDMIGHAAFDRILEDTQPNARRDFELLCQVYNTQIQKPSFVNHDNSFAEEERSNWNDLNANIIQDNRWNSDSDSAGILSQDEVIKSKEIERNDSVDIENNVPSGKVILETEIQFNSSTAVTMKILEEGESKSVNDSDSDEDNRDCVVKVLTDSDNDDAFELRRRTPRRVRFGGEVVKLRTPDSDSNQPSDTDNDITITTTPTGDSSNPVIEIKFITNDRKDGKRSHRSRSLIPVPVTPVTQKPKARSLPTSPSRKMETRTKSKLLYQSHPNLTREHFFVDKQNKSVKQKAARPEKMKVDSSKKQTNYVDNATSPMLLHKEVELFHNLTRSPIRSPEVPEELPTAPPPVKEYVEKLTNDRKLSTADSILLESKQKIREERSITTADSSRQKRSIPDGFRMSASTYRKDQNVISNGETLRSIGTADTVRQKKIVPEVAKLSSAGAKKVLPDIPKMSSAGLKKEHSVISNVDTFTTDMSDSESNPGRTFSSFILKDSGSDGIQSDCYIPTIDNGESLTCSSSGSEGVQTENSWETAGVLDKRIIEDMHDKDDWRIRLRGFESFAEELRTPVVSQELTPYMSSLLHFLFNAERHPRLQSAVENVLKQILSSSSPECLKTNLSQIAVSLSKMGAPAGIRLAIIVMQKLSAKALVQHLLEDPILTSRSAKSREGAMQILLCATTMFPSTEFDTVSIANRVALVATDRKRRIRQSTLDVLAVLGQIGNPGEILEAVALASKDLPDRDGLIAAVRARLSRRQFPIVEVDGTVVYASPAVGHGADVEWVAAGSGSISPCSARSRRRVMETTVGAESSAERAESAIPSQRNMWSARSFKDPAETFGGTVQHQDNVTWALVPVKDKEESQTKPYSATQLWAIEQSNANGDIRLKGNSGSLRPVYLLQAQQQAHVRLRQTVQNDSSVDGTAAEKQHLGYSRGRSSSPPVRLVQIKGATRASRGQSSSPPEYGGRPEPDTTTRRRMFPLSVSSGSSQSRGSPPRNNWQREFQSAIPVPVGAEGRSRFRKRYRDSPPSQPPQPMVALGSHGPAVGSAPVRAYERTKSPSPNRFSSDKFNISQDSGINQQTSSGSESSDYYTPPAEPYLPLQPTEPVPAKQNGHEDSFDQSDRSETPPAQQRERFINLEDSQSGSDFEDQEAKKNSEDSQDDHDFVRSQVFQKLQEEHIARVAAEETAYRELVAESRLTKSHADLSEVKKLNRKSISSAPLVKHMKGNENHFIENKLNNSTVDEESKSSRNSSTLEVTSINQSQTELRSLNQSQLDVRSLNQSQGDLRSSNTSHSDLRSIDQSQGDLRSLNQSQADLHSLNESQGDHYSLNQSQGDLQNGNQNQKDLRSLNQSHGDIRNLNQSHGDIRNLNQSHGDIRNLNQSHGDIRNLNQSQADLRNHNYQPHEVKSEIVKCPDIVKKTPKLTPKSKAELKRRSSNMPAKIPPVFPDSLRKFPKPREGMSEMISQLESPEWEMTMKGLQSLVRLIRHHPEMIEAQMHTVCVLLGRHIKNLRSQVARASCLAAAEMFTTHRKPLEMELEEIACPLLQRTADTNKFLRADANGALDAMCININTSRVMSVLSTRGATHHNAVVRCTSVRLVTELVRRLGSQRVFQLPKDTRDRMLLVGANMLTEGSLETRKHAKNMFTELSGHPQFQRAMSEAVPASTMRHISKIINSLK